MTYHEFITETKGNLEAYLGDTASIREEETLKNNSIRLRGISITPAGGNISPTIYLEQHYQAYQRGMEMSDIIMHIIKQYEANKPSGSVDIDFYTHYEQVEKKVICKLISFEKNQELLAEVPYIRYLDLAIVFYCMFLNDEIGPASILIYKKHLKMWNVTTEELYQRALENTRKLLGCQIRGLEDIMEEMLSEKLKEELKREIGTKPNCPAGEELTEMISELLESIGCEEDRIPMYVLSNQEKINGASCLLYKDVLDDFAERMKYDLFIIPSSIHELILVPAKEQEDRDRLTQMVQEVNATQLNADEILADHVYYFSRETKEILSM